MTNIFEEKPPFRIWSILNITGFEYEGRQVPFSAQHRIVFAYMASLASRYGDIAVSYVSVCKKAGVESVEESARIFDELMAFGLIEYVPASLFDGERVKFKYRVNYPDNTFPYPINNSTPEK
ncbi:TPA: hypothetical protein ACGCAO_003931 [Enterobacter cloacae]